MQRLFIESLVSINPKWLFNEADQDHVGWSYKIPSYSIQVTVEAVTTICEAVRQYSPETRIFLPVSSNIYGNARSGAISEHQFLLLFLPMALLKVRYCTCPVIIETLTI